MSARRTWLTQEKPRQQFASVVHGLPKTKQGGCVWADTDATANAIRTGSTAVKNFICFDAIKQSVSSYIKQQNELAYVG